MRTVGQPLRLSDISMRYGETTVLESTDLQVNAGEFLTLLGPSGSGKSTLLNLVAGYIEPVTGTIHIGERDVTRLAARRRNIGMVFQNYALFPHMNVRENIAYGLSVRGVSKSECERRVSEVLSLMQLEDFADRPIQKMSGGQQQRVALARALVIEPDVLLMDEPLSALDKQLRRTMQLEIRRLHRQHGRTTIYVTHDQEEALVLSDRIAVMDHGCIQQVGSVDDLYDRPVNSFVAGFIGESNLLEIEVTSVSAAIAAIDVEAFRKSLSVPAGRGVEPGCAARLLIRPEHIIFEPEGSQIPAEITEVVYLGELSQYTLQLENGRTLTARQITDRSLQTGTKVGISWKPEHARAIVD